MLILTHVHPCSFWLAIVLLAAPPQTVSAVAAPPISAHVAVSKRSGMTLTLRVLGGNLAWNSLVRSNIKLQNTSKRTRHALFGSCDRAYGTLSATVLQSDGLPAPSPVALNAPMSCGPPPRLTAIAPAHHITRQIYLVLTSNVVQGAVAIGSFNVPHLLTVTLQVHLSDEPPPYLHLQTTPSVRATIIPTTAVHGQLMYAGWTGCYLKGTGDRTGSITSSDWGPAHGHTLTPQNDADCSVLEWHAVAGWLNHPVVAVDYSNRPSPFDSLSRR